MKVLSKNNKVLIAGSKALIGTGGVEQVTWH